MNILAVGKRRLARRQVIRPTAALNISARESTAYSRGLQNEYPRENTSACGPKWISEVRITPAVFAVNLLLTMEAE